MAPNSLASKQAFVDSAYQDDWKISSPSEAINGLRYSLKLCLPPYHVTFYVSSIENDVTKSICLVNKPWLVQKSFKEIGFEVPEDIKQLSSQRKFLRAI